MNHEARKAAIAAYKERRTPAGIYVIRCNIAGECWVGFAGDLDSIANRIWFSLKMGRHGNQGMQAAWNRHGMAGFVLEPLERFGEELADFERAKLARDRLRHWQGQLAARLA